MPPKKSALPTKERTLFARLILEYENKKHKLGIKTADAILKKFPEHGETLCMKGLLLASLNRREEGIELAKKGVRFDLTSFICWHALGILNRMDKNYEEAIKCYSQALRIESGNFNLLRESAFLHLQLRNYAPLIDARLTILKMQPHLRMNWVGLAVAHHLAGSSDEAIRVLEGYENVMRDVPKRNYEHSEVLLYHASILQETKQYAKAVELLEDRKDQIVDEKARIETLAKCFQQLDKKDDAEKIWRNLIASNAENRRYFAGLLSVHGVQLDSTANDDNARAKALSIFSELQTAHPKSTAAKRLALVFATGDEFKAQAGSYIRNALTKGIPSLFSDLKSLYRDAAKQQALEEVAEALRLEWAPKTDNGETETDPPSSYLWALYYLAQHYSYIGQAPRALAYIDSAIAHSSTLPELHMIRARVLKRGGDLQGASDAMTDARLLDGQDRFLNSKAAKYLLRIEQIEEAVKVVGLFTKPDAPDPVFDLNEMQALWYLVEEAEAYQRAGDLGMALKRLHQVDRTFQEIYDDQLDFHSYCLRKMTLRSYVSTCRFEDQLRSHPAYFRAALSAIRIYTDLHDKPTLASSSGSNGKDGGETGKVATANGEMSEEEKKKAAKKAKKAELKAAEEAAKKAKEAAAKKQAAAATADDDETPPPPEDKDPKGLQLLSTASPLDDATAFLRQLHLHAPKRVETWLATFEVAFRQRNWLLCVRALTHAHKLEPAHPDLVAQVVRIKLAAPELTPAAASALATVVPADVSAEAYYTDHVQKQPNAHALGALLALRGADEARAQAVALASTADLQVRCCCIHTSSVYVH